MYDLDTILSIVENPTRRKILQALVREPHYPLQLSRELGISQPAVMKNLEILERSGLVESWRESSDKGPDKIVYRPISSFTLTIDMRNGMFKTNLIATDRTEESDEGHVLNLNEIREDLSEIDRQIEEFDRLRGEMIRRRNMMISSFMNGSVTDDLSYLSRSLLYELLNSPDHDLTEVSKNLGLRDDQTTMMVEEIECKCKDAKERNEQ